MGKNRKWPQGTGVYTITCQKNNRVYVGKATDISNRVRNHFFYLRKGTHHNSEIQQDYNTYGEDWFLPQVFKECSVDQISEEEEKTAIALCKLGYDMYNLYIHTERSDISVPAKYKEEIKEIVSMIDRFEITPSQIKLLK